MRLVSPDSGLKKLREYERETFSISEACTHSVGFLPSLFAPPKHSTHRLACRCKSSEIRCLKCFLINYDGCLNLGMIRIRNMSFKKMAALDFEIRLRYKYGLVADPNLGQLPHVQHVLPGFLPRVVSSEWLERGNHQHPQDEAPPAV